MMALPVMVAGSPVMVAGSPVMVDGVWDMVTAPAPAPAGSHHRPPTINHTQITPVSISADWVKRRWAIARREMHGCPHIPYPIHHNRSPRPHIPYPIHHNRAPATITGRPATIARATNER